MVVTHDARLILNTMPCILVVEDDQSIRRVYERILLQRGHTVCFAPSALGALDLIRIEKGAIDLVLLDLRLGRLMSGIEVARELRGTPPAIVITGMSLEELRRDPLEFVAKVFQKGEFTNDELLDEIDRQLGSKT